MRRANNKLLVLIRHHGQVSDKVYVRVHMRGGF